MVETQKQVTLDYLEKAIEHELEDEAYRRQIAKKIAKLSRAEESKILKKHPIDENKDQHIQVSEVVDELLQTQKELEKKPSKTLEKEIKKDIQLLEELGLHKLEKQFGEELKTIMRLERNGKMETRNIEKKYKQYLLQVAEQYRTGSSWLGSKYFYDLYRSGKRLLKRRFDIFLHFLDTAKHINDEDLVEHLQGFAKHNSESIARKICSYVKKNRVEPYIYKGLLVQPVEFPGRASEKELHQKVKDIISQLNIHSFGFHVAHIKKTKEKWTYMMVITAEDPYKTKYPIHQKSMLKKS